MYENNYIQIRTINEDGGPALPACSSYVGFVGGDPYQTLQLSPDGCLSTRAIQHEMIHALGKELNLTMSLLLLIKVFNMSMNDLIETSILTFGTKTFFRNGTMPMTKCLQTISIVLTNRMISNLSCIMVESVSYQKKQEPPESEVPSFTKELMYCKFF